MASNLAFSSRATPRVTCIRRPNRRFPLPLQRTVFTGTNETCARIFAIRVSGDGGDSPSNNSYLEMWRNAVDRERKAAEFQKIADNSVAGGDGSDNAAGRGREGFDLERKSDEFNKILEVPKEERERIQRMHVIDRAAAAISAARALLKERSSEDGGGDYGSGSAGAGGGPEVQPRGSENGGIFSSQSESSRNGVPGPDFWSWAPPSDSDRNSENVDGLLAARKLPTHPTTPYPLAVKEHSTGFLSIPFESKVSDTDHKPPIPPLQSLVEVGKVETFESSPEMLSVKEDEHNLDILFTAHAAEAAHALNEDNVDVTPSSGINLDGSRWWKETGIEQRPDGVICRWTMARGVSADQEVEWQEKFWEAADEFGYKELGSEKSGRDATGNVWREYWRESMWQDSGLVHIEKTADKWGKNGKGDEWQEKWWEHHDASNKAEKWAHKWCSIDPATKLEAGHAHVWHERWGENYDGHGGSVKYTDKWAERCEGDGWMKWGDKWDEHFGPNGHGVKQGETWWEGMYGERWNRTWGEHHNGSGWVHKYGKSSCGEHWDTHVQQETWYERFPHYGFYHCFDNSVQLREVKSPSESESDEI